jgi:hypothetical protein
LQRLKHGQINNVIKIIRTRLLEIDDNLTYLIQIPHSISTLESTIITNSNEFATLKTNIPTLPISTENINYVDVNNYITALDAYLKNTDTFKTQAATYLNFLAQDLQNLIIQNYHSMQRK